MWPSAEVTWKSPFKGFCIGQQSNEILLHWTRTLNLSVKTFPNVVNVDGSAIILWTLLQKIPSCSFEIPFNIKCILSENVGFLKHFIPFQTVSYLYANNQVFDAAAKVQISQPLIPVNKCVLHPCTAFLTMSQQCSLATNHKAYHIM